MPKNYEENICMVILPDTELGKATRASFQSLILQLEKRFTGDQTVSEISIINKKFMIKIDSQKNAKSIMKVGDFVVRLKEIENDISQHMQEKVLVEIKDFSISTIYKPNIKAVPPSFKKVERLILIDGSNVLATAFHATKKSMLKRHDGLYTNAVYIMAQKILDLISRSNPSHLAIAWDEGRENTFRRKIYPDYKANRKETEPELKQQFTTAQKLFSELGIAQYSHKEIEADDVIGSINAIWRREKGQSVVGIISNDKDLFQLLSENTSQLISKSNREHTITPQHLMKQWNVAPDQWADCKALLGDKSDNIPGCPGVGEKAAYPLIARYGCLETLYEKLDELKDSEFKRYVSKLKEGRELTFLSKQLAMIRCDTKDLLKISSLDDMKVNLKKSVLINTFKTLGFKTLIASIEKGMYRIG